MAGNSEFLTETAAENRPFISLDIDFFYIYISNLAATGLQGNYSWERMINRYIYNRHLVIGNIFEIRSSIFFSARGNSKFRGRGERGKPLYHPALHPELIPGQLLTIWKSDITSLLRPWSRN